MTSFMPRIGALNSHRISTSAQISKAMARMPKTPMMVAALGYERAARARAYPAENPDTLPTAASHVPAFLYLLGPASRDVRNQRIELRAPKLG